MIRVRPMELADRPWVNRLLEDAFADATVARKGVLIDASQSSPASWPPRVGGPSVS